MEKSAFDLILPTAPNHVDPAQPHTQPRSGSAAYASNGGSRLQGAASAAAGPTSGMFVDDVRPDRPQLDWLPSHHDGSGVATWRYNNPQEPTDEVEEGVFPFSDDEEGEDDDDDDDDDDQVTSQPDTTVGTILFAPNLADNRPLSGDHPPLPQVSPWEVHQDVPPNPRANPSTYDEDEDENPIVSAFRKAQTVVAAFFAFFPTLDPFFHLCLESSRQHDPDPHHHQLLEDLYHETLTLVKLGTEVEAQTVVHDPLVEFAANHDVNIALFPRPEFVNHCWRMFVGWGRWGMALYNAKGLYFLSEYSNMQLHQLFRVMEELGFWLEAIAPNGPPFDAFYPNPFDGQRFDWQTVLLGEEDLQQEEETFPALF